MSPTEESAISAHLNSISTDIRLLYVKLFGEDQGKEENAEGRIPRLEAGQRNHGRRIARLEALVLMVAGAITLVKVGGWALEAVAHFAEVMKH